LSPKRPSKKEAKPEAVSELEAYRQKRDPGRTPEPFGRTGATPTNASAPYAGRLFVVHKHWARNLHYDLRLEIGNTLKSWAVPKGPSTQAEEKRLAVHVEDHPLEYGDFEGIIPPGNYGAGNVIIWDHGWFRSFKPEPIPEQYERGKLELELFGHKLRGRWTLVKMGRKDKEWLLLKKVGAGVSERELIDRFPQSVISGLPVEDLDEIPKLQSELLQWLDQAKAPRGTVRAKTQAPTLATLAEKPFSGAEWIFEIKYDGVRVLAERDGDEVRMYGRSGQEITSRYPEVAGALSRLWVEHFVVDGEIVATDEAGGPSFQRLQARMHLSNPHDIRRAMTQVPATAFFFDCLSCEGRDLKGLPLVKRKECLSRFMPPLGQVRYSDHVAAHGEAFYDAASEMRLEGIVAKRATSTYSGSRGRDWIKIKCQRRQEFVIGGWTDPGGGRGGFGALDIGLYRGEDLVYVTKVGTGFDMKLLDSIRKQLDAIARDASPFTKRSPKGKEHHWVEPKLVCEVRFTEWTTEGGLRHPAFLGLRNDKKPEECVFEVEVSLAEAGVADADGEADPPPRPRAKGEVLERAPKAAGTERVVRLTNLDKVFWPKERYTKGDLIGYYEAIAPLLLPYLAERPLFLTRYPDGIEGKSFYQKDAPVFVPDWVRTEPVYSGDSQREIRYFVVDDVEQLRYIANLGTIPLHTWSSRLQTLEQPDWMILDLDPKTAPFSHVIRVARTLKKLLDEIDLPAYIKTSGATGLHVLVPLGTRYTYEQSRGFARLLAVLTVHREPEIATVVRQVQQREGKVYVDFGQNGHGQTVVSPYSVRPLPAAPASCPLLWEEVNAKLDPAKFTIKTIPERFQKMKDPLRPVLAAGIEMAKAIGVVEELLKAKE